MTEVARQFSAAASRYDQHSDIQQRVFAQLLEKAPARASHIVDIGSGTGAMTALLGQRYPHATIVGVDMAPKMVMFAQQHYGNARTHFVCSGMERFQLETPADLLFSNATFQWVPHPKEALIHAAAQLAPNAHVVLSSFGPETYRELAMVIRQVWGHPVITSASGFLDGEALKPCLDAVFGEVTIVQYRYQRHFESLAALLRSIKHTGTRGIPEGPKHWTPGLFREVERAYVAHYRRIVATYQVFYCTARCG
jgi:malonyl-CoA O-methyltransferase